MTNTYTYYFLNESKAFAFQRALKEKGAKNVRKRTSFNEKARRYEYSVSVRIEYLDEAKKCFQK